MRHHRGRHVVALAAACVLWAGWSARAEALAAQGPAAFSEYVDLTQVQLKLADLVQLTEPAYESQAGLTEPSVFAKHIRIDGTAAIPGGTLSILLDGDVRIRLHMEWAPPALNDASQMRLKVAAALEVTNLAYRIEPTVDKTGPCADRGLTLLSTTIDVLGVPVNLSVSTRACSKMSGVCEGVVNGWVQATCGLAPQEEGGIPVPYVDFDRSLQLSSARVDGTADLELLNLRVAAKVGRMGANLLDASVQAACPFITASAGEDGATVEFGAKADLAVNCSAALKLLGMKDQRKQLLFVERLTTGP